METLKAHGDYPQVVYRVFTKREHAEAFIKGEIRFSLLEYYKNIEDIKRQDITEGDAHIIYNGIHHHSSFASNRFYILCCHRSLEAAKQSEFGDFIVEITNPELLAIKITKWLEQQDFKHFGGIEGVNIEYTYGEKRNNELTSIELAKLTYSQKPDSFKNENEFRLIFIRKLCQKNHVFVQLDEIGQNCKLIYP